MKIFILEDDANLKVFIEKLQETHDVDHENSLIGAYACLVDEDPGIDVYDAVILDLTMAGIDLDPPGEKIVTYNEPMGMNGLKFFFDRYESLFCEHLPKIVFYSAYLPSAKNYAETIGKTALFNSVRQIDKGNNNGSHLEIMVWLEEREASVRAQL